MRTFIFLSLILAVINTCYSQGKPFDVTNAREGETVEYCLTHKKMNALMQIP